MVKVDIERPGQVSVSVPGRDEEAERGAEAEVCRQEQRSYYTSQTKALFCILRFKDNFGQCGLCGEM